MYFDRIEDNSSLFLLKSSDELKTLFLNLKEERDIARLLEVSYDRLKLHTSRSRETARYKKFLIAKKSGGTRTISAPCTAVKILQRKLSQVLYSVYESKAPVHGFVPARSILTNAEMHIGKRFILNIDLKDFFHSIHFGRVQGIFTCPPYCLPQEVAKVLAQLCCYSGKLPQGAPTSPIVSNMICTRMDSELRKLAQSYKCTYTRYADDITFSTTLSKFPLELAFITNESNILKANIGDKLNSIVQVNGFEINANKTRLQHKSRHQEVTGLTVNKFPNVKRSFVREISAMLYEWDKCLALKTSVEDRHRKKYEKWINECGQDLPSFKNIPSFRQVLRGKIMFLGMIKGKGNKTYLTYLKWFYELCQLDPVKK